jgi:pyruvate dehydrogenase E1 component alpha subunit
LSIVLFWQCKVDGMDLLAVREATKFATEHCRAGKGPLIMECATYRYHGHSMSDPGTSYRTREQIQAVRSKRDPITGFKERIIALGLVTAEDCKAVEDKVKKEIEEATVKAKTDPEPPLDDLYTNIYSQIPEGYRVRGCDPFSFGTPK